MSSSKSFIGSGSGIGGGFLFGFGGLCFFCLSRNCSGGSIIRLLQLLTLFRGSKAILLVLAVILWSFQTR